MTSDLRSAIRTVPNFPKPGIMFRDITTLLKDPRCLAQCVDLLAAHYGAQNIDIVAGVE